MSDCKPYLPETTGSDFLNGFWDWEVKTGKGTFCDSVRCMLGYDTKAISESVDSWQKLLIGEDLDKLYDFKENQQSTLFDDVLRFNLKTGGTRALRCRAKVLRRDNDGKPEKIVGLITAEDPWEKSAQYFQSPKAPFFETLPFGYQSLDADGVIREVNQVWLDILGYERGEVMGRCFGDFLTDEYRQTFNEDFALFKEKGQVRRKIQMLHKSDKICHIQFDGKIIYNSDGSFKQTKCIMIDETDHWRNEQNLRHSNDLFDYVISHANSAIVVHDRNLNYVYVSERYLKDFNVQESDVIGKHHYEVFPDLPQKWRDVHQRALRGEVISADDDPFERQDGSIDWTRWECRPWYEEDGTIGGIVIYTEVINERKRIEDALASEKELLSVTLRSIGDGVITTDTESRVLTLNKTAEELTGWSQKEAFEKPLPEVFNIVDEVTREKCENPAQQVLQLGTVAEFTNHTMLVSRDGREMILTDSGAPIIDKKGKVIGVVLIFRDITEIHKLEKDYRTLFRKMIDGFALHEIICDDTGEPADYRFLAVNPAFEKMTGLKAQDVIGKTVLEILPGTEKVWIEEYGRVALTGEPVFFENFSKNLDKYFQVTAYRPGPDQFACIFVDITKRKKAEQALEKEKELLSVTLKSIGDGVITTDTQGRVVMMNNVAEELTGWTQQEASGRPLTEVFYIVNEMTGRRCENPVEKVLKTGTIVELANHTMLISKHGREIILADSGAPIVKKGGEIIGVVLVFRDVTEKQKLEESVQQTDKLESIGILAGGIAHDFNNLLGGIFGYLDMAREACEPGSVVASHLDKALKTFTRANDLTKQLLTFAKGGVPSMKTSSLAPVIKECTRFALSGSNVTSSFDIEEELWLCEFDENQIGQVVDNLSINAVQAMPLGGRILVTAQNRFIQQGELPGLKEGKYVHVSFADSGVGIPSSIMPRLFDPFFTTKQKGNGLGLSTVYSIMKKHDGKVEVESEPDKGAVFHLYFPISEKSPQKSTLNKPVSQYMGSGWVLVMDDEDYIREAVGEMLKSMGFSVKYASNGSDAIDCIKGAMETGTPFTAAIMDLTIPGGMGGIEAIQKVRELNREVVVFVSSGYSDDPVMADPQQYGFTDKLKKPFRKVHLEQLFQKHFG